MKMNIKDIMEQMQETPSPRCWESIASQLPAAGTAVGSGAAATAAKGALSAGKLAAIIGSATAVVATVIGTTFAIMKNEPSNVTPANPDSNTTIIVANNTEPDTVDIADITEPFSVSTPASSDAHETPVAQAVNTDAFNAATSTETITAPAANLSSTPSASSNTITSPSTKIQTNDNTTVSHNQQPNSENKTQENTKTETVEPSQPENDNYWENAGYSRPIMIEIPNVFTPNGDGVNDFFVINGIENCEKKMLIVKDRSGQTVFQSRNYDNSWDGGNLPDGTYLYQFSYSINNINELRQGAIMIKR